jgi:thiamine biosynthesis lipoprotein
VQRREFVGLLAAGCAPAWLARGARGGGEQFAERWSWAMGQAVHVMAFASSEDHALEACAAALAELRRVEARLSVFDDASDLCELNRRAGRAALRVDADLRAVLEQALAFRRATGGAFDVAVEPLMRVWGFHRPRRTEPAAAEIAAARAAVRAAEVRLVGDTAFLPSAHTQLDFGGIGVGYGIDRALTALRAHHVHSGFVDVSGDCGAVGAPPGERGWPVAVADPRAPGGILAERWLRDAALATSSNSASVVRYGRAVRGHVMNPDTGRPASARWQATVVARTAVAADALSTGALVSRLVGGAALVATLACGPDAGTPSLARVQEVRGSMLSAAVWGGGGGGGGGHGDTVALGRTLDLAFLTVRQVDSGLSDRAAYEAVRRETAAAGRAIGLKPDSSGILTGFALDQAGLVLSRVADSALLDWNGHFLWISGRGHATRRMVGIADPRHGLNTLAAVELRSGSVRTAAERAAGRSLTVLAASGAAAGAWAQPLWALGCDRALTPGDIPAGLSVVCTDTAGVGWTADLEGRVVLPTAPGAPPPVRRPAPAPGRGRGPTGSTTRSPGPGS